ncbi:MAG TPA: GNAT family N-acetyltransferase, partial [Paraburkholderia sp.]|nr:GNAT family N-acetyltransferase [Paraburkholderia sp.]
MSPSLTVRRITADQGAVFRDLRTASLREAPYAFGATLEDALSADAGSF